jgi:predicted secreted protein
MRRALLPFLFSLGLALAAGARGEASPPPSNVVGLSASAVAEVAKDWMTLTLGASRDGADPNLVQADLKKSLEAALAEARRAAKPGQVEVQTGNFSLVPRYSNKGVMSGWQGTAELIVSGRDMPAIGQLAGRISTMTVARVGYSLSREQREKVESEVAAQAIARYQAKAADYAKRFGFASYGLREVSVESAEAAPPRMMAMQARAMASTSSDELPIEAGKATVTVTVNGTVQLSR